MTPNLVYTMGINCWGGMADSSEVERWHVDARYKMVQTEIKPGAGTAAGGTKQLKAGESLYSVRFSDRPNHCYLMVRNFTYYHYEIGCGSLRRLAPDVIFVKQISLSLDFSRVPRGYQHPRLRPPPRSLQVNPRG